MDSSKVRVLKTEEDFQHLRQLLLDGWDDPDSDRSKDSP